MIEEQFVSFDTAKMLKEAGFDALCYVQYSDRGVQWDASCPDNFNADDFGYSCPTQALAARWLREVYGFCISVDYWKPDDALFYCNITQFRYGTHRLRKIYSSYEEALEDGIQDCLKRINR